MASSSVSDFGAKLATTLSRLRAGFETGKTKTLAWRQEQLKGLQKLMNENETRIIEALQKDLKKPTLEAWLAEVSMLNGDISHALKSVSSWMAPQRVSTPIVAQPGTSEIRPEPYGVTLIIAPWNYPWQLAIMPLVGALAAGNCALIKPSEVAPATAGLISELLPRYLDNECIAVLEGGPAETSEILKQQFDYIFYTGSTAVGKIIAKAAAEHLTPTTLELGGKSPCIVDESCDLGVAAKRIAWGKFSNCGQTCIAPDYIFVHSSVHDTFVDNVKNNIKEFYGEDAKATPDYARIINQRHASRLAKLLTDVKPEQIVAGGQVDEEACYVAPTIVDKASPDSLAMADEIFGPILPVMTYESIDEVIRFINARPKPLALYMFSTNSKAVDRVIDSTSAGGVCINDVIAHFTVSSLPFGGVGASGVGAYHGKFSFDTFSHHKSIHRKATWVDPFIKYAPYTENKMWWFKNVIMRK